MRVGVRAGRRRLNFGRSGMLLTSVDTTVIEQRDPEGEHVPTQRPASSH